VSSAPPSAASIHFLDEQTAFRLRGTMPVYMRGSTAADVPKGEKLGQIEARSCKEDVGDKGASQTEAVDLLRQQGTQAGATAVVDVTCSQLDEKTYVKGCWLSYAQRISCRGEMIRAATAEAEPPTKPPP
jgi:hypothetical protein